MEPAWQPPVYQPPPAYPECAEPVPHLLGRLTPMEAAWQLPVCQPPACQAPACQPMMSVPTVYTTQPWQGPSGYMNQYAAPSQEPHLVMAPSPMRPCECAPLVVQVAVPVEPAATSTKQQLLLDPFLQHPDAPTSTPSAKPGKPWLSRSNPVGLLRIVFTFSHFGFKRESCSEIFFSEGLPCF